MEENNKIIAEFLLPNNESTDYYLPKFGLYLNRYGETYYEEVFRIDEMKFHSDWNWLMEVVEKIENLNYWINFHGNISYYNFEIGTNNNDFKTIIGEGDTKFKAVYDAIIKFINFYNKQKEE